MRKQKFFQFVRCHDQGARGVSQRTHLSRYRPCAVHNRPLADRYVPPSWDLRSLFVRASQRARNSSRGRSHPPPSVCRSSSRGLAMYMAPLWSTRLCQFRTSRLSSPPRLWPEAIRSGFGVGRLVCLLSSLMLPRHSDAHARPVRRSSSPCQLHVRQRRMDRAGWHLVLRRTDTRQRDSAARSPEQHAPWRDALASDEPRANAQVHLQLGLSTRRGADFDTFVVLWQLVKP